MNTLAIDTAGSTASVALRLCETVSVHKGVQKRSQASELSELVDSALKDTGATLSALNEVVVSVGPGSFTGVRVGIAYAKGLALGQKIRLSGISRFQQALHTLSQIPELALIHMKSDTFYVQEGQDLYTWSTREIIERLSQCNAATIALIDDDREFGAFRELSGVKIESISVTAEALLSVPRLVNSDADELDWLELEPIYVGPSTAERRFAEQRGE